MKTKEQWINEAMESFEGIQRAEIPVGVEEKILLQVSSVKRTIIPMQPLVKWIAAASIFLLAGLNVLAILHYNKSAMSKSEINPVYNEYFTYLNNL